MNLEEEPLDLLVIGGGPAGLTAALLAGRASLRTCVVDAGDPRSAVVSHTHGLFTRDGASPHELRSIGRSQLERYPTVSYREAAVVRLEREPEMLRAGLDDGTQVLARHVVLASGWRDDLSRTGIPDLADVYEIGRAHV